MGSTISKKQNTTLIINNDLIINITIDGKIYNKNRIYIFSFKNISTFMILLNYNYHDKYLKNITPTNFEWNDTQFIIKIENIKLFMTNLGYNKIKGFFNSHYKTPIV
tara:strand:- start:155 stop:475 length:321 start_codon:yes stop_codon:yes gene_type:complete